MRKLSQLMCRIFYGNHFLNVDADIAATKYNAETGETKINVACTMCGWKFSDKHILKVYNLAVKKYEEKHLKYWYYYVRPIKKHDGTNILNKEVIKHA